MRTNYGQGSIKMALSNHTGYYKIEHMEYVGTNN